MRYSFYITGKRVGSEVGNFCLWVVEYRIYQNLATILPVSCGVVKCRFNIRTRIVGGK